MKDIQKFKIKVIQLSIILCILIQFLFYETVAFGNQSKVQEVPQDSLSFSRDNTASEIEKLKDRVDTVLEAVDLTLKSVNQSQDFYRTMFLILGALGSFLGGLFVWITWRRERSTLELYKLQEDNLSAINSVINAVQNATTSNFQPINEVLISISNILSFKATEAKLVVDAQKWMETARTEFEKLKDERNQRIEDVLIDAKLLQNYPRFVFEEPDFELKELISRFKIKFDNLPNYMIRDCSIIQLWYN